MNRHLIPIFSFLFAVHVLRAQDVEQVYNQTKKDLKENPASVRGSIGLNATGYKAYNIADRRDPFYWVINANLNFTLFNKIQVPFTAVFTQADKNFSNGLEKFSQPFNQFGISPRYRWLTVHAGFRTLEFSEYTLSGAMFLGGGVEINPKNRPVSATAFYGRFEKAIPKGGIEGVIVSLPAYERKGGGAKVKIGDEQRSAELIFLKISDDKYSIPFDTSLNITPSENQVIGLSGRQRINSIIRAYTDFAYSMYTKNLFDETRRLDQFNYSNQIYQPRSSTQFNKAITAGFEFTPRALTLGIKYKRIDPDYKTLGSVFLANDVEEISLNAGTTLMNSRISLNTAAGLQRNNLDRAQALTSRRFIGSATLIYHPTAETGVTLSYSDFSSNTIPVRDVFTDSIRLLQLTRNGSFSFNTGKQTGKIRHSVANVITCQESSVTNTEPTTFINETLSYNIAHQETNTSLSISYLYNQIDNKTYGPNRGSGPQAGIQQTFLRNRLRISGTCGYQMISQNNISVNRNISATMGCQYKIDKLQSVKFDCSYIEKIALRENSLTFAEIRVNVGYTCNFGVSKKTLKPAR